MRFGCTCARAYSHIEIDCVKCLADSTFGLSAFSSHSTPIPIVDLEGRLIRGRRDLKDLNVHVQTNFNKGSGEMSFTG